MRSPDRRRSVVSIKVRAAALLFPFAMLAAAPAPAADDPALLKDLTAVLMLLAMPCGEVVSAKRQGDNDHIATCKDGNRYRVFVNAEGRASAQKL
jgi:hypothetical protein